MAISSSTTSRSIEIREGRRKQHVGQDVQRNGKLSSRQRRRRPRILGRCWRSTPQGCQGPRISSAVYFDDSLKRVLYVTGAFHCPPVTRAAGIQKPR
jgi:hypothetical protein